jgi:ABC-type antimicrobial peptide transport system permease subunit
MGAFFPFVRISATTAGAALALSLLLALVAALIPAYRASKLDVVDALRRIG